MWQLTYKGFLIAGYSGFDECLVHWETPDFVWETMHKSVQSAKMAIGRYINNQTKEKHS